MAPSSDRADRLSGGVVGPVACEAFVGQDGANVLANWMGSPGAAAWPVVANALEAMKRVNAYVFMG